MAEEFAASVPNNHVGWLEAAERILEKVRGVNALTARERQIAQLAAKGISDGEIADALVVTVKTVEFHMRHIYRKLGVTTREDLRRALDSP